MPVMRSPQGEELSVGPAGLAAMRALGWTERGPTAREQSEKRRPGRPRKSETESRSQSAPSASAGEDGPG